MTARTELEFDLEKVRDGAPADITKGRMSTEYCDSVLAERQEQLGILVLATKKHPKGCFFKTQFIAFLLILILYRNNSHGNIARYTTVKPL